jgi:hypothetical protein
MSLLGGSVRNLIIKVLLPGVLSVETFARRVLLLSLNDLIIILGGSLFTLSGSGLLAPICFSFPLPPLETLTSSIGKPSSFSITK